MIYTVIQYIFVSVVFVIAVLYVIKMAKSSFGSKSGCSKGCGCSDTIVEEKFTKKN